MVVGGGITGMQAALGLADSSYFAGVSFIFLTPPFFLDIETSLIVFYQVTLRFSLFASKRKKYTVKTFQACAWLPQNNLYAENSIKGAA